MMKLNPAMAGNEQAASMTKTMNLMMPIMSLWFGFTLPAGVGLYWIMNSFLMAGQQIVLNKIIKVERRTEKKTNRRKKGR
jgi:YidC/Oxa1 family membrane protein insertase